MTWRRAGSGDLPIAAAWVATALLAFASRPLLPWLAHALPPCALHALTGVPCVACGSTRAALSLAAGDWTRALALNPLAGAAMIAGLAGACVAPVWIAARGPLPRLEAPLPGWWRAAAWLALAAQWGYLILTRR